MGRANALCLTGMRFSRWTVLEKAHKGNAGEIFWLCRCDCGTERPVKGANLKKGGSKSCGCYHVEVVSSHGMTKTRTWKSWDSMMQRCNNPKSSDFPRYGGRGVCVVPEWHTFAGFLADMGERPDAMTLDRKDVHGHYGPANCRWADTQTQNRNKGNSFNLTLRGVTKNVQYWSEELGIPVSTLKSRIESGWSEEDTLTKPVRPKRPSRKEH